MAESEVRAYGYEFRTAPTERFVFRGTGVNFACNRYAAIQVGGFSE